MLDVFNPWDLIKAVGRGFRWFAVGRRRREQDISYQTSKQGTGLEPTRNTHPYRPNDNTQYEGPTNHPYTPGGGPTKKSRYSPLSPHDDEDDVNLLSHAQTNPQSQAQLYPRPGMRLPDQGDDLGAMGIHDERGHNPRGYGGNPDHLGAVHPPPSGMHQQQQYQHSGVIDSQPLHDLDTGYHGASSRPAYGVPDAAPQRPPGRPEHKGWNEWERDLGRHEGAHF